VRTYLEALKALADGNRLRVVAALLEHDELCVCQIVEMLDVAPPTVSRHLSILQKARLVLSRKEERWVYYRLDPTFPQPIRRWLEKTVSATAEIAADRQLLADIVTCERAELCRNQKARGAHR
jgi:ArsR family transcriptional regulator